MPVVRRSVVLVLLVALLFACGQAADEEAAPSTTAAAGAGADAPPDPGRVVALGEEYLLADLLALGITPVASTATTGDEFHGLDEFDTSGIEPAPSYEPNIELLASFEPDLIVLGDFVLDHVDREVLEGIAPLVVTSTDAPTRLAQVGEAFGLEEEAAALQAELDATIEEARTTLEPATDQAVSVATIYPGPTPAVWVDGPTDVPQTLLDLGFTLTPARDQVSEVATGRSYLSLEQLGLLDGDVLITLQSDSVQGESASLAAIEANPLWQDLPAVAAGEVVEMDRLGYPGTAGRIRLVEDLVEALG